MPRCWPSVRGNSTASSTASASYSSRRSCWWDRTWQVLRLEPWGPLELPGPQKVPQQRLNSNSSSSTSHQGTTQWRENPLPHRVTSAPWPGALWTTSCPAEFPWITRRWWGPCRASSAAPWTPHCSRGCFSSLEGLVSSRKHAVICWKTRLIIHTMFISNKCLFCCSSLWIIILHIVILIHPTSSYWNPSHTQL